MGICMSVGSFYHGQGRQMPFETGYDENAVLEQYEKMEHSEHGDGGGDDLYAGIVKQCSFRKHLCSTPQPDHGPVAGGF